MRATGVLVRRRSTGRARACNLDSNMVAAALFNLALSYATWMVFSASWATNMNDRPASNGSSTALFHEADQFCFRLTLKTRPTFLNHLPAWPPGPGLFSMLSNSSGGGRRRPPWPRALHEKRTVTTIELRGRMQSERCISNTRTNRGAQIQPRSIISTTWMHFVLKLPANRPGKKMS